MPLSRIARKPRTKARSMTASKIPVATEPTEEQIRRRAYEVYRTRGAAPGSAYGDWVQAQTELRARIALLGRV